MSARKSSAPNESLAVQAIQQQCKLLRLPTVGAQFETLAKQAIRERQTPVGYLEALLSAELEERERRTVDRRLREARLPRMKTLEEFDFSETKAVSAPQLTELAEGGSSRVRNRSVSRRLRHGQDPPDDGPVRGGLPAETAGALHHGVGAGQRTRRSQAANAAESSARTLVALRAESRSTKWVTCRWRRWEQSSCSKSADRAEKADADDQPAVLRVDKGDSRSASALLDRINRAHIIETGEESYRFRRTLAKKKRGR